MNTGSSINSATRNLSSFKPDTTTNHGRTRTMPGCSCYVTAGSEPYDDLDRFAVLLGDYGERAFLHTQFSARLAHPGPRS
jgi:hypothetical protein